VRREVGQRGLREPEERPLETLGADVYGAFLMISGAKAAFEHPL